MCMAARGECPWLLLPPDLISPTDCDTAYKVGSRTRRPALSPEVPLRSSWQRLSQLVAMALLLVLALLLGGCEIFDSSQNTLAPKGDVAELQRDLFIMALIPAVVIFFLVEGAVVYIAIRFRRRRADEVPKQVHGNQRLELAWTIAPAVLLLGMAGPIIVGIVELGKNPGEDALAVTVYGQRFSWEFQYDTMLDAEGKPLRISTPEPGSEYVALHIPVDRDIDITLVGRDVIHSFWVPALAGKQDAIPGESQRMWLNATTPGLYPGQCAELCGIFHAKMKFDIVAESEAEFQAWANERLEERNAPPGGGPPPETTPSGE